MQSVNRARLIKAAVLAALLGGCSEPQRPHRPVEAKAPAAEAGYVDAPAVVSTSLSSSGVRLVGQAPPKAQVQLTSTTGAVLSATADNAGRWGIQTQGAEEARLFNLSAVTQGRRVQGQGYVLVASSGKVTLLRAGAGAFSLQAPDTPRLTAVDFDREGGAIVSGQAPPESAVSIRIDGRPGPVGSADAVGRFSLSLTQPFTAGTHQVQMLGDSFDETSTVVATPAAPLTDSPFRASATPDGLRVDWMTPGGGLQTTWILD